MTPAVVVVVLTCPSSERASAVMTALSDGDWKESLPLSMIWNKS